MAVIDEIYKWASTGLPTWQSDAVRRLLTQDSLSATDEQELFLMLKACSKLLPPGEIAPTPKPLPSTIPGTQIASQQVTLLAMKDLTNVNAIPLGSRPLTFGNKGITIIYGDNASGKSGYARVLKKACRARHTEPIYPDVREQAPPSPAGASFVISILGNSQPEELQWAEGSNTHEILGNIFVFDSKCARIIIDEDNEPAYLPYGASVFHDLGILCKRLKVLLEAEWPQVILPKHDIQSSTQSGKFIATLNINTTIEDLNAATKWSQEDDKKLQDLMQDIAKATAEDTKQQALRVSNLRHRISDLKLGLDSISSALSAESVIALSHKIAQVKAAKRAFAIASQQSLPQEPLPCIEQNEWKDLYEAAKEYSTKIAYKDKDFPFTGPDSVCVLCMQPLSQQAKDRLQRFKSFMEQTTKKHLETVEKDLLTVLNMLANLDFEILESYKDAFDEISARNKPCADSLKVYIEKSLVKKMSMESAGQTLSDPLSIELPTCPMSDIKSILTLMEQDAVKLEGLATPQKLAALNAERNELAARKKLVEIKPNVIQYLSDLYHSTLYTNCSKETDTTQITKRGRVIISAALTEQFKNLLNKELADFGSQIKLTLELRGTVGETIHKLILRNCQLPKGAKVSDILSEGEERIVSIASFLAELEACGHSNPVVFDDPVSSLDHIWREKVANRLTREAAKRQVIIFTHDIVFTTAVMYAAKTANIPLTPRCIQRLGDKPGSTADEIPWKASGVDQKIDSLEQKVAHLRKNRQSMITDVYEREVFSFYSDMRRTCEKIVEEVIFANIVKRYDSHIPINREIMKVTVLETDDCKSLLSAYKKCCDLTNAHDNIGPRNAPAPNPDEVSRDVNTLKYLVNKIRDKQKTLS